MPTRLPGLTGSRVQATLQIAERAINDVLALIVGASTHPVVELLPERTVLVRYGLLHARAELPPSLTSDARLSLHLASLLVAMALKALVRQPFVHVHGRHLTIDLAAIPALHPWRDLWRHIDQLTFETVPGALRVGLVAVVVDADDELSGAIGSEGGHDPGRAADAHRGHESSRAAGGHMREWIDAQMAEGFPALSGSVISGTLAVKQEALNELLAKWLAATAQRPDDDAVRPEWSRHVRFIKSAAVRAEPGTVLVDFTIAV